jgi:hypothetical protein
MSRDRQKYNIRVAFDIFAAGFFVFCGILPTAYGWSKGNSLPKGPQNSQPSRHSQPKESKSASSSPTVSRPEPKTATAPSGLNASHDPTPASRVSFSAVRARGILGRSNSRQRQESGPREGRQSPEAGDDKTGERVLRRIELAEPDPENSGRFKKTGVVFERNLSRGGRFDLVEGDVTTDLEQIDRKNIGYIVTYAQIKTEKSIIPFASPKQTWESPRVQGPLPMTGEMRGLLRQEMGPYYYVKDKILPKIPPKNYVLLTVHGLSGGWHGRLEKVLGADGRIVREFRWVPFEEPKQEVVARLVKTAKEMRALADARGEGFMWLANSAGVWQSMDAMDKAKIKVDIFLASGSPAAVSKERLKYVKLLGNMWSPNDKVVGWLQGKSDVDFEIITQDGHAPGSDYYANPAVLAGLAAILNRGTDRVQLAEIAALEISGTVVSSAIRSIARPEMSVVVPSVMRAFSDSQR